jgi:hypothetical protein
VVGKFICWALQRSVGHYGRLGIKRVLKKKTTTKGPVEIMFSACAFIQYWAGLYPKDAQTMDRLWRSWRRMDRWCILYRLEPGVQDCGRRWHPGVSLGCLWSVILAMFKLYSCIFWDGRCMGSGGLPQGVRQCGKYVVNAHYILFQ